MQYPEGGYHYIQRKSVSDSNFYFYPVKDIVSRKDSLRIAYDAPRLFPLFHEPNISLGPADKPIFRFVYFPGALERLNITIISLTENEIIVKEGVEGNLFPADDTSRLSDIEQMHHYFLKRDYPLNYLEKRPKWRRFYDSLIRKYPELSDPAYYLYLLNKALPPADPFIYSTRTIRISKEKYAKLVSQINESGYWKLPYDSVCHDIPMDSGGFLLEANTPERYNIVQGVSCPNDTTKFVKACQQLVKSAGLDYKIKLIEGL